MDIFATLVSRRSVGKVTDEPLSQTVVEKIMEAGTFAPTHKRTDPWRFVVFEGEGREKLSNAMVAGYKRTNPEFSEEKLATIKTKAFRAPTVVLVWCAAGRGKINPPVWEDHAATAACLQNMCLAAHGFGLGAIWRSGSLTEFEEVQALCQTEGDKFSTHKGDKIMGILYLGKPDCQYKEPTRSPEVARVTWYK